MSGEAIVPGFRMLHRKDQSRLMSLVRKISRTTAIVIETDNININSYQQDRFQSIRIDTNQIDSRIELHQFRTTRNLN